ncbi:DUF4352 domain-containing protein [Candidatus Woesearchaeota archaeon]|nr:DUF4352 domain-containing protein [Candidatus Woesearchaeota archaeon]
MGVKSYLFVSAILVIIFVSACTTDRQYQQPRKVEDFNTNVPLPKTSTPSSESPPKTPVEKITEPEKLKIVTFKVGESASDGRLKITLNSFSFNDKITYTQSMNLGGEEYKSSLDFNPKESYQFLIIDITVENLQSDKTTTLVPIFSAGVSDAAGYSYDYSLGTAYLDKKLDGGDLLPGMKRRGNMAFEIPQNTSGLKFTFQFDLVNSQTAVFDIK